MAYDSFPWDGRLVGHAASTDIWSAPYNASEYADVYSKIHQSNVAKGYVIPGYNNNLAVTANSPVALNVLVDTGAIYVRGRILENTTQVTATIGTADATNPRIDRIVARVNLAAATQTWEIAVVAGTAAATPAMPALTQNATTYEISLAYVWVAAAVASIAATEIHDERIFEANFESLLATLAQQNLLSNSEFMAFSRLDNDGLTDAGSPDGGWSLVGTVTSWANLTRPSQMSRGRAVKITAGAATSGMQQSARVRASTTYAIKGLIQVTAGDVGRVVVTTNSASPGTVTKLLRRTGAWLEYLIYYTTEADASMLTLQLLCNGNTDIVDFGQWLIVEGYVAGPFRQVHETVVFDFLLSDPDFDGDTFATSGTTTIDFDTDYQAVILPGTRAVLLEIEMSSTNTSLTNQLQVSRVGSTFFIINVSITGLISNNTTYNHEGWAMLDNNMQLDFFRNPGASTMTLGIYVKGIIT